MSNATQPALPLNIPAPAYYQLIHTLAGILPPPLADTPEALFARNQAAIDKIAAMMPVNANEADLAAQCVAARAQAEDVMRLLRVHDGGDMKTVMRLNAQYAALVRASLSALGHLQRTQAVRHKREGNTAALNADEWTQYGATRTMQRALDAGLVPAAAAAAQSATTLAAAQSAPAPEHSALAAAAYPPAPTPEPALAAPSPASVPAAAPPPPPPPAPTLPPVSAPATERWPAPAAPLLPAAPVPASAPRRSRRLATPADADEPSRDLPAEADYYAVVYPNRAREMRRHGGLPPNCSFGPPDDALVHAIVTGTSPILRALDLPDSATA